MSDYTEYERAFDWNIADLNFNKITLGEYERKFRQIVDKIRADAIDECIAEINKQFMGDYGSGVTVYPHTICNILEQLKGQS